MTAFPLADPKPLAIPDPAAGRGFDRLIFALERPQDAPLVDDLIDRAFGPGRFAKTAERLREGNRLRADLSICAWDGGRLAGAVRLWPIVIGDARVLFLGPFAVDEAWRNRGLGRTLIRRAGVLADAAGERAILLVGDAAYFRPLGYDHVPRGRIALPGPVDPARVLWRAAPSGSLDGLSGPVRIAPEG